MTWTTRPRSEFGGLAAIDAGAGPLVVLLHGVGLRAEAWNRQSDALAPQCRVVAVDLPGHGESAWSDDVTSLRGLTDMIAEALPEPAMIIGHSMGAMIALDLALKHPPLVRGVAALNAIFERAPLAAQAVKDRARRLDGITPTDPAPTLERWFGTTRSPERTACAAWLRATDPAAYRRAYSMFATENGPDRRALEGLTCPALFMTGAEEPNSTPAMSRAMAALAPKGQAQIVQGAAHMMPMTHAAEVNAHLVPFVQNAMRSPAREET